MVRGLHGEGGYLDTSYLMAGLKAHTVRGGAVAMVAQFAKLAISLGMTMVLARILLPSDYGLVAMVTAITGLLSTFMDVGLSMATLQRDKITQEQVSTLFWVNVAVGLALMLITAALAPIVARFYREPRLVWITLALASGFLASAFAVQHQALLQRQMRFGALAMVDVTALCAQSVVGIALALAGCGYWALVFGTLAGGLATTTGLWMACRWRPGRPARGAGVRSLLAFGGNLAGFNIVNYCARKLDNVLIGRVWGEQQLGFYAKAYSLLLLPVGAINAPIAAVIVPALSRLQSKPEEYRGLYLKVVSLIAFITMPIGALMIVASRDLIRIALGQNWLEASSLLQILGISAFLQPIYNTQGWLHASLGRTDRMLRWGLVGSTLIVASFFVGLPFGARGVALAYSSMILLITWPCLWYAFRSTQITIGDLLGAIAGPLVTSLLAAAAGAAVLRYAAIGSPLLRISAVSASLGLAYLCLHCLLPSGRRRMRELKGWMHALVETGG